MATYSTEHQGSTYIVHASDMQAARSKYADRGIDAGSVSRLSTEDYSDVRVSRGPNLENANVVFLSKAGS